MTQCYMPGYSCIIDDGEAKGHGYFLPKQPMIRPLNTDSGVTFVDVPLADLRNALTTLSQRQKSRLEEMQRAGQIVL